ncbi:MYB TRANSCRIPTION FACTOR-RELATED-RELATED [Salix viminalis]|uniref:MYB TRANSCRIPTION FACTOR-RELATED-RELATED n=1 Tax=Salix viminalis TaxID=40686 RepID=A0A9Q0QJP2_SALVM|nr:MYB TRANSCRIPTION FACTOR-RELATED-RELATED [Salix viminalis]
MGRGIAEEGWRKGPWTAEEDKLLSEYVSVNGEGRWSSVSRFSDQRKAQILKPEMQQQYQQQLESGEMKMENTIDDHFKMNEAETFHNLEDQCWSAMSDQDVASWADFVVEDCYGLWGGLWNLDDHPQG